MLRMFILFFKTRRPAMDFLTLPLSLILPLHYSFTHRHLGEFKLDIIINMLGL